MQFKCLSVLCVVVAFMAAAEPVSADWFASGTKTAGQTCSANFNPLDGGECIQGLVCVAGFC
ncbi:hypothetical protein BGZ95_007372, partial [Linnemannia exigua]